MKFNPALLTKLMVEPMRYFYANYTPDTLRWHPDEKIGNIEIDSINNYNKVAIQAKPRILVGRGQFQVRSTGLTDNLAQGKTIGETRGTKDRVNMILLDGVTQILLEARSEGVCEMLADLTYHFLIWTSPVLCDSLGFKNFANNLAISPLTPNKEDTEIFQCTINVPWQREEHWHVTNQASQLKDFILKIVPQDQQ